MDEFTKQLKRKNMGVLAAGYTTLTTFVVTTAVTLSEPHCKMMLGIIAGAHALLYTIGRIMEYTEAKDLTKPDYIKKNYKPFIFPKEKEIRLKDGTELDFPVYYDDRKMINATTYLGGCITLTNDIVNYLSSNEMTYVLCHEKSHAELEHVRSTAGLRNYAWLTHMGCAVAAGMHAYHHDMKAAFASIALAIMAPAVSELVNKKLELFADSGSIHKTKDVASALSALCKLETYTLDSDKIRQSNYGPLQKVKHFFLEEDIIKTHPNLKDRVINIAKSANKLGIKYDRSF